MFDGGPLLFVLVAVAALGLLIWQHVRAGQRREALALLAARRGLDYARVDPFGLTALPFAAFRRGDDRGAENVVSGTLDGEQVLVFDLWVRHESRDSKGNRQRRYERFTCARLELDGVDFPHLTVAPETLLTRAADLVGARDLEFESDDFNRTWNVRCGDARFASALLDPRMMRWLLHAGTGFSFEVLGRHLLVVTDRLAPDSFLVPHHALVAFRDRIPGPARAWYPAAS